MAGMQIPQSMVAAQHRTGGMANMPTRSGMPMGARPQSAQNQMMAGGAVRPQTGVQQQNPAFTRTARNVPQNVSCFEIHLITENKIIRLFL